MKLRPHDGGHIYGRLTVNHFGFPWAVTGLIETPFNGLTRISIAAAVWAGQLPVWEGEKFNCDSSPITSSTRTKRLTPRRLTPRVRR